MNECYQDMWGVGLLLLLPYLYHGQIRCYKVLATNWPLLTSK